MNSPTPTPAPAAAVQAAAPSHSDKLRQQFRRLRATYNEVRPAAPAIGRVPVSIYAMCDKVQAGNIF